MVDPKEIFGENVFGFKQMQEHLSDSTFKSLKETIDTGKMLDASIADEVAETMRE